ncbi:CGNR zinc finger domain-containing protein [Saccharopolyspora sp. K220]|uniref:CGNR zinc finger domain-containing protein n=1 Tax=Saccharopolyspora soli TaxID=2926618 RepID=UPI001F5848BE|nr:CGNR zinc finger domain-containing protein [Saccharopolyspora soli]MCI2416071.1 CGNR zinc finger domain-containing protein [Saccharopolyspora soli]
MELGYERPEDRPAAPAPLDRVQEFINTRINLRETGDFRDELASPTALRDWLSARGLLPRRAQLGQHDLDRAIAVREGLRAMLARNNDASEATDAEALRALDEAAAMFPLRVSVGAGAEPVLGPAGPPGFEHALAGLLADVVTARSAGLLSRLKACRDPACRWVFYDSSKNRSGAWCSMAACGAASKKRHFTERRRQQRQRG